MGEKENKELAYENMTYDEFYQAMEEAEVNEAEVNIDQVDPPCGTVNLIAADCCTKKIPHGFVVIGPERLAYTLELRAIHETCERTVNVPGCGNATFHFNQLRVVGCIRYAISTVIQGECGGELNPSSENQCLPRFVNEDHRAHMCCEGVVCVDNVLICREGAIGDYDPNLCANVVLSGFRRFITNPAAACSVLQSCPTNNYFVEFKFANLPQ